MVKPFCDRGVMAQFCQVFFPAIHSVGSFIGLSNVGSQQQISLPSDYEKRKNKQPVYSNKPIITIYKKLRINNQLPRNYPTNLGIFGKSFLRQEALAAGEEAAVRTPIFSLQNFSNT